MHCDGHSDKNTCDERAFTVPCQGDAPMKSALRFAATITVVFTGSVLMGEVTAHAQGAAVRNFVLGEGGVMNGDVRNAAGQPLSNARVTVSQSGQQVAVTQTDQEGMFSIGGLREGQHVVTAGNESRVYRFWNPESAPPQAESFAQFSWQPEEVVYSRPQAPVRSQPVRRGGFLRRSFATYPVLTTAALLGAGIGSGIAIGSSGGGSTPASP